MTKDELKKLFSTTRSDGTQLYSAANTIYALNIFVIFVIALLGAIVTFILFSSGSFGVLMGLASAVITAAVCILLYLVTVMSTHIAKVLVNISYAVTGELEEKHKISATEAKESKDPENIKVNFNLKNSGDKSSDGIIDASCPACAKGINILSTECNKCGAMFGKDSAWNPIPQRSPQ